MKSILIVDTPKNCPDCQLMADGWCYGIPSREEVQGKIKYLKRPSWCPLKPLPILEDEDVDIHNYVVDGRVYLEKYARDIAFADGYNTCLKEILGETE